MLVYLIDIHSQLLIVGTGSFFCCFLLTLRSPAKEDVVDQCILQQSHENEDKTPHKVHINGFHIWNFGKSLSKMGVNCCHCEHSCDSWKKELRNLVIEIILISFLE